MKNYNEWEDLVGSNGRYKIRLNEDNRTLEIRRGEKKKLLKLTKCSSAHIRCIIRYEVGVNTHRSAQQLAYIQWVDNSYVPKGITMVIDHIDSDVLNNHPDNLRLVTHRENCSKERTARSGLPVGVSYMQNKKQYRARIIVNHKEKHIGVFPTPEQASAAYQKALKQLVHV